MASELGIFFLVFLIGIVNTGAQQYNGKLIGEFPAGGSHIVGGNVYAVDDDTIRITNFDYDGKGPDAHIWIGKNGNAPSSNGESIYRFTYNVAMNDEYLGDLDLPSGDSVTDLKWISVWCKLVSASFDEITVSSTFTPPAETNLGQLSGTYGLSASSVVIVNDQRIRFEGFNYDGSCSGAQFWAGNGPAPSSSGHNVPDENGNTSPLSSYSGSDIELVLPDDGSVFDIDYIGVWCQDADVGHVVIPQQSSLNIPPRPL
ncbi:protein Skeletor, isoforms B/C-like [Lytechinus pictus]|uniref:protein Skeletor, isoforms B/C-like n=1 Tax=Lytechinus pictus TaxID=7653 RepID=UPI0030BA0B32